MSLSPRLAYQAQTRLSHAAGQALHVLHLAGHRHGILGSCWVIIGSCCSFVIKLVGLVRLLLKTQEVTENRNL